MPAPLSDPAAAFATWIAESATCLDICAGASTMWQMFSLQIDLQTIKKKVVEKAKGR
jgi:hypothetical protein